MYSYLRDASPVKAAHALTRQGRLPQAGRRRRGARGGIPVGGCAVRRSDLLKIFSPLILYAAYLVHLVLFRHEPFLLKWLDGCFSLFLALVLCNLIRSRLHRRAEPPGEDAGEPPVAGR